MLIDRNPFRGCCVFGQLLLSPQINLRDEPRSRQPHLGARSGRGGELIWLRLAINSSMGDDVGDQHSVRRLHVKLADGSVLHVPYSQTGATVSGLKAELERLTGLDSGHQRLVFAGQELKDDGSLLDTYGVASGTEVHMLPASRPHPRPPQLPAHRPASNSTPQAAATSGSTGDAPALAAVAPAAAPTVAPAAAPAAVPAAEAAPAAAAAVAGEAAAGEAVADPMKGKKLQLHTEHVSLVEQHRRRLLGVRFEEMEVKRVLGSGCNGAVLDCVVRGVPVALKIMFNYGQSTTLVADLHATE